jgi:hypothetical protein
VSRGHWDLWLAYSDGASRGSTYATKTVARAISRGHAEPRTLLLASGCESTAEVVPVIDNGRSRYLSFPALKSSGEFRVILIRSIAGAVIRFGE